MTITKKIYGCSCRVLVIFKDKKPAKSYYSGDIIELDYKDQILYLIHFTKQMTNGCDSGIRTGQLFDCNQLKNIQDSSIIHFHHHDDKNVVFIG